MELEIADFNLREILENITISMAQRAASKGLELTCLIPSGIPVLLRGDSNRLRQILVNLVGNAIKFTEHGEVVLQVKKINETSSQVNLGFYVKDTGIGVPEERQKSIFERFTQGDESTRSRYGGTGLGLAISAQLVTLLGGKISLHSQEGIGSTFSFNVPFIKQPQDETSPLDVLQLVRSLKFLILDPNENSYLSLKSQIEGMGAFAVSALDENQCLEKLERAASENQSFQIIFIDSKISSRGGGEFIQKIRSLENYQQIPLVLLTTLEQQLTHDAARGYDAQILKPVRLRALQATLRNILSRSGDESGEEFTHKTAPGVAELKTATPGRILLVEDNSINRKVVVNLLKKYGHRVDAVENGRQALDILTRERFNLILMDVQMPVMDGIETTTHFRASEDREHPTPIIAMTAHALTGDIERCFACGMDDFISKPVKPKALYEKVEHWLSNIENLEQQEADAGEHFSFVPGREKPVSWPGLENESDDHRVDKDNNWYPVEDRDFEAFSHSMDTFDQSAPSMQALQSFPESDENKSKEGLVHRKIADLVGNDENTPLISSNRPIRSIGEPGYLESILTRFGNDYQFFLDTFEEFIRQCRLKVQQLNQAAENKDLNSLHYHAHNLLGVASNFEARAIVNLLRDLEVHINNGDLMNARLFIFAIEKKIPELDEFLNQYQSSPAPVDQAKPN